MSLFVMSIHDLHADGLHNVMHAEGGRLMMDYLVQQVKRLDSAAESVYALRYLALVSGVMNWGLAYYLSLVKAQSWW